MNQQPPLVPALPLRVYTNHALGISVPLPAVEEIFGVPTDDQILVEHRRMVALDRAQYFSGNTFVNNAEYVAAVRRYHLIMSVAMGGGGGVADIPNLARTNAANARRLNAMYDFWLPRARSHPLLPIVKELPGHPLFNPPVVVNVVFNNIYNINDNPPENLIPENFDALQALMSGQLGLIRDRLRAIYWFYNDPRLVIGHQANRTQCGLVLTALKEFLLY